MQPAEHETGPKHTTEAPNETLAAELAEVLARLNVDQIRFVVARQEYGSDREAAEAIDMSPNTVKQWKYRGAPLDEAVRLMVYDGVVVARTLRRRHLAKAMAVKVAGLDEDDQKLRQGVATEVIEWEMGKATQKTEAKLEGGVTVVIDR